jgi:hypothetical protein
MDELKLLIEMVASLPAMAVWVLVGFYAYKVVVIGSIYGVIRLAIVKTHNWLVAPKTTIYKLDGLALNETVALSLAAQLSRLSDSAYIHASDVAKLAAAIDHIQIEAQKRSAK